MSSILCAGVLLFGASASASAQETDPVNQDAASAQDDVLLRERNRASMHPGNPLELVGLEQGDNDLRSRTPALANSNREVLTLNADDNYERTLAMYDRGARFSQPGKTIPKTLENTSRNVARGVIAPPDSTEDPSRSARWFVLSGLLLTLAGIAKLLWRRVSAGQANSQPF